MPTSHDPLLESARTEGNDDLPIWALEVVLNDKREPWSGELAADANDVLTIEHESCPTESRCINDEDLTPKRRKEL